MGSQLRQVLRRLAQAPLFTAVTLLTLAVGIGANTAIFSVVSGVLLKPLPYPEPERLVGVWHSAKGLGFDLLNASPSTYLTYSEEGRAFEQIGIWQTDSVTVTGLAEPEQVDTLLVTHEIFPTLRVQPVIGRTFNAKDDEPSSPECAILSYAYWQRKFGGDPSAIGRRIMVDGKAREVIGIMPQSFKFLQRDDSALILPLRFRRAEVFVGNFSYQSIARLKPGVTLDQANADVARMLPMMLGKFRLPPGFNLKMFEQARFGPNVRPLKAEVVGDVGKVLWVLMGTVGMVLLIACANVANLLLVRAEGRQQELAVRAALGAGWGQIARELLLESVMLGILGGALGLALAYAGIRLLVAMGPSSLPRLEEISIDPLVLLFTLGISLAAGLLFGIIPVFKYAGAHLGSALRQGGRSLSEGRERHRARNVLVVSQVALALVLLISSGLMLRTAQAMRKVSPGFVQPDQVLTFYIDIPVPKGSDPERAVRDHQQIVQRIQQIPGVTSVALSSSINMSGDGANDPVFVEDHPTPEGQLPLIRRFKWISGGYFATMGNPIVAGRDITWTDVYNKAPVGIVSESFARLYWKQPGDALGKRIRETPGNPWREIVGVVGDERADGVNKKAPPIVYWPLMMSNFWDQKVFVRDFLVYVIRSPRVGAASFMKEIRDTVWSVNPNLPIANARTLQDVYTRSMARTSFTLVMLGIAAAMALLLGVVGIYGVISYSVTQRTREIGIRVALGAPQGQVQGLFVRHGLLLTALGVAVGLGAALAVTRLMTTLLFEVSALDPVTYVVVSLVLVTSALLASYLPARRASAVDPVEALRAE